MERLTAYDGDYYYPHCMRGSTCDGRGPSEKCKECEFDERICVTLGKYEDTGLTPEQIRELKERNTAKAPIDADNDYGFFTCPSCGEAIYASDDFKSHKFCLNCGQRIWWKE